MREPAMTFASIVERLERQFGADIVGSHAEAIDPSVQVAPQRLVDICRFLRDEPDLRFNLLQCISGVDYSMAEAKKGLKADWQPHIEVLYHLSSLVHRHRLVIRLVLPRWKDDVPGQLPEVPSVSGIWSTADWHEREVYDLSGVFFTGHPDLRRILCPEDWEGHPLRKDYQTPQEYHGIRVR